MEYVEFTFWTYLTRFRPTMLTMGLLGQKISDQNRIQNGESGFFFSKKSENANRFFFIFLKADHFQNETF